MHLQYIKECFEFCRISLTWRGTFTHVMWLINYKYVFGDKFPQIFHFYLRSNSHIRYTIIFYVAVIRGRVETQGIINNVNTVSRVKVKAVYKHGVVPILQNATVDLWTNSTCVCPKLVKNREYLLIGYEDPAAKRLLFLDTSLAAKWKTKWDKRLKVSMVSYCFFFGYQLNCQYKKRLKKASTKMYTSF